MAMRRKWVVVGVIGAAVVAVIVIAAWPRRREPVYQGRKLSEWVMTALGNMSFEERHRVYLTRSYDGLKSLAAQEAVRAVRHVGTNGIPFFLRCLRVRRPPWHDRVERVPFVAEVLKKLIPCPDPQHSAAIGSAGLHMLGHEAVVAVPELTRIMLAWRPGMGGTYALENLAALGPVGLNSLLCALTNRGAPDLLRMRVAQEIGSMGTNGIPAIPALTEALGDPDYLVRGDAAYALRNFGGHSRSAVPALMEHVKDGGRVEAALREIAPEVLTNGVAHP
ncbi:MAG TPA: HEAT repeat domain-containing protein [Candidatus Dormibacteraeota bacterium]|nr:HEAT repeat domain-containing protein [Candidatus Dormibacteraeota bacterium]